MKVYTLCFVVLCTLSGVLGARILALLPLPGKSHFIYTHAVLKALAARGHQVTVYSPFVPSKPVPNMKHVEVHTPFEDQMKKDQKFDTFMSFVSNGHKSFFGGGNFVIWHLSYDICDQFLNHQKIKELVASKEQFDLIIAEALFGEESMLVFGHIFKAPTVNLNGFGTWSVINKVHGNDLQIASYPDVLLYPFSDTMNFVERLRNLISNVITLSYYYYDHLPKHDAMIKKAFNDPNIPPVADMVTNLSLTLANFHPTVGLAQSIPSNIVPIGGVHIAEQIEPLPKDIKTFLDSGKNSVIYFSLGTVVPVHQMPEEYIKIFVNVFRKLPYKVLWKIEADSVPDLPKNVMIAKWVPQQSVLAHPNCVLFITHGGLLSQQEAMYAGVPVVGIPFFGDQPFNVKMYEHLGIGVGLDFSTLSEESMQKAVMSVVGKPQFVERAKKVSELFRHRPMSPSDTSVYWLEYVLRHNGAYHLRPQAANMPWYQLYLLDILAVALTSLLTVLLVIKKILSMLFGLCSKPATTSKQDAVSSRKKKN